MSVVGEITQTRVVVVSETNHVASETKQIVVATVSGPQGPRGADGAGDKSYTHDQGSPSSSWVITHGLSKHPSVTIVDSGGTTIVGVVTYNSVNQVTVDFSSAFAGKAYLN